MHFPFPRHDHTAFITLHTGACHACGACIATCARRALGLVNVFNHRHAHVDAAARCVGCLRCVNRCLWQAISANSVKQTTGFKLGDRISSKEPRHEQPR